MPLLLQPLLEQRKEKQGSEMMEKKIKKLKNGTLKITHWISQKEISQLKKMSILHIVPQILAASIITEIVNKEKRKEKK